MVEVATACVAAIALVFTSGYALGGARRRKAIRELLEIRNAIEGAPSAASASRTSSMARVDVLVENELTALEYLGDTTMRWFRGVLVAAIVFGSIAVLAAVSESFLPSEGAQDLARYVSAAACLLTTVILAVLGLVISDRSPNRFTRWGGPFVAPLVTMLGFVVALVLIYDTPYYAQTFGIQ